MNEMKKKGRRTTAAPTSPTYRLSSEYTTILPALYDSSLTFYSLISCCDKDTCKKLPSTVNIAFVINAFRYKKTCG
jgi:hypothetical protein